MIGGGRLDLELQLKDAGRTFEITGLCSGLGDEDGGLWADLVGDGMRNGAVVLAGHHGSEGALVVASIQCRALRVWRRRRECCSRSNGSGPGQEP